MTRRWPDSLPPPVGRGYRLELHDTARRTEFEVAVRARRLTHTRRDRPTLAVRLTDAEFHAFRAWWGDEAWSLARASDSLAQWSLFRLTRSAAGAMGPDDVPCDVLVETAETGAHHARVTLLDPGWAADDMCSAVVSLLPLGRSSARVVIVGRDDTTRGATVNLTSLALSNISAGVGVSAEPHRGWVRVRITAPVGSGGHSVRFGVFAQANTSYAGEEGLAALAVGQVNARRGADPVHFVPADTAGRARGTAGGSAWFACPVALGGGHVRREVLPLGPASATPLPGLAWEVTLPVEARDA